MNAHLTSARAFSYATRKGQYLSMWSMFLFLTLSESILIVFLVLHFVPTVLLQTLILGLLGCFLAGMFGRLLFPLWTRYRVSATELELHYGLEVHARIPLAQFASAQPVKGKMGAIAVSSYNTAKQRLKLAFSERGQVLLSLKQPMTLRYGLRSRAVSHILISVDDREAFLAALDLVQTDQTARSTASKQDGVTASHHEPRPLTQVVRRELAPLADDAPVLLRAEGLTRRYANFIAVNNLNLAVRRGEIYSFLGPNGAGKSTTIKMLVGLLQPTSGQAWLAGHDVWREALQAKMALGYVADRALDSPWYIW
jgi:ABC-2 type transport system ATP-binding protein